MPPAAASPPYTAVTAPSGLLVKASKGDALVGSATGSSSDLVSAADMELFKEAWAEFDPDADNFIPASDLNKLILSIPPPLGRMGVRDQERQARRLIMRMKIEQVRGEVGFSEVLKELCHYSFFGDDKGDVVNFLGVQIEVSERVAVGILQNAEGKAKQPEKGPAVQAAAAAAAAQLPPKSSGTKRERGA